MNRFYKVMTLFLALCIPHILGGASCSQALDLPIIVKGTLPNSNSKEAFALDVNKALAKANIRSTNGKVPPNAPKTLTVSHTDVFNLAKKEEFKKYGARINSAYINHISVEITKNSLTINVPKLNFSVAPIGSSGKINGTEKFIKVAEVPPLARGIIGTPAEMVWEEKVYNTANEYLRKYVLGIKMTTTIELKEGAPIPKGNIDFNIHFEATFVLKAI